MMPWSCRFEFRRHPEALDFFQIYSNDFRFHDTPATVQPSSFPFKGGDDSTLWNPNTCLRLLWTRWSKSSPPSKIFNSVRLFSFSLRIQFTDNSTALELFKIYPNAFRFRGTPSVHPSSFLPKMMVLLLRPSHVNLPIGEFLTTGELLLLYLPRIGELHSIASPTSSNPTDRGVRRDRGDSSIVPSKDRGVAFHRAAHPFLFRHLSRNGLYTSTSKSSDHIDRGVRRDRGDSSTVSSKERGFAFHRVVHPLLFRHPSRNSDKDDTDILPSLLFFCAYSRKEMHPFPNKSEPYPCYPNLIHATEPVPHDHATAAHVSTI